MIRFNPDDDNAPGSPPPTEPAPDELGRCASCDDEIPARGPAVCSRCFHRGYCPICGVLHGGAQMCPDVRRVWQEQEAIERAIQSEMVISAARAIHERFLANPIWQEAA